MNIEFSIADESKVKEIIELCNECFDEDTNIEAAQKIFQENKYDGNQIYLIGEHNGKVIAHTRIAIVPTMFTGMDTFAILNHVCVKPEYRKHKVATEMLKIVEKICDSRNCSTIKLWSRNFRKAAHACYYKFGFTAEDATFFSKNI